MREIKHKKGFGCFAAQGIFKRSALPSLCFRTAQPSGKTSSSL
jgi:hypothetical protein